MSNDDAYIAEVLEAAGHTEAAAIARAASTRVSAEREPEPEPIDPEPKAPDAAGQEFLERIQSRMTGQWVSVPLVGDQEPGR